MLKGKHIVLGITGSIAAYKACLIIRGFIKQGAEVQVVITPAGKEFITPITLSALTSKPVISEFFAQRDGTWNSHVNIGQWADVMLIAPATASTIGKMAHGIADNMLITTYLSMKAPVFIAPAMDLDMYAHPSTQHNLELLKSYGNHIIEPGTGFLAGVANTSEEDYTITTLRAREYLYNERDRHPDTGLYTGNIRYACDNMTLDRDPDFPSTLRFYIQPSVDNVEGDIYISGYDIAGNYRNNEILHVACPHANQVYEFVTSTTFRSIDHEGIDAQDLEDQDAACRLWIKDSPVAYIYAVGTNSGRPLFEAVYERLSPVPVNKLFLGYAITDEHQVIEMQRWITDSFAEVVEDLTTNGRADGYNKVFVMNDMPKEGTETVILDGIVLMKDSPHQKGYTIQGNVITLQENVPAPDSEGNVSGNGPADFWVKYRRV